jgi:DNA-binding MurR/RpiR family transcriptional regulator
MPSKQTEAKRKKSAASSILLRYRDTDSDYGVSRATTTRLAQTLGLSETQVIHVALAALARQELPQYEPDNGPLTKAQKKAVGRLQPSGRMKVKDSLF